MAGRDRAELFDGVLDAGTTRLDLRPMDGEGRRLPGGIYFMRLDAGGPPIVRRIAIAG